MLYTNPLNKAHIAHFGDIIKTVRVLINTPAAQVCDWGRGVGTRGQGGGGAGRGKGLQGGGEGGRGWGKRGKNLLSTCARGGGGHKVGEGGKVGSACNFHLDPFLTLGCDS